MKQFIDLAVYCINLTFHTAQITTEAQVHKGIQFIIAAAELFALKG
jgi:hypothetical protein